MANKDINFEKSVTMLEDIIFKLEHDNGEMCLDECIHNYQEGMGLISNCYDMLNKAEQKIFEIEHKEVLNNE